MRFLENNIFIYIRYWGCSCYDGSDIEYNVVFLDFFVYVVCKINFVLVGVDS